MKPIVSYSFLKHVRMRKITPSDELILWTDDEIEEYLEVVRREFVYEVFKTCRGTLGEFVVTERLIDGHTWKTNFKHSLNVVIGTEEEFQKEFNKHYQKMSDVYQSTVGVIDMLQNQNSELVDEVLNLKQELEKLRSKEESGPKWINVNGEWVLQ